MAAKRTPTFEERLRRLQEIVTALEISTLELEAGVRLYKEGLELSRACREQLETARNDIRILTVSGTESFDASVLQEEGDKE